MQEKRTFEKHEDKEKETLIYDYQHVDKNSERHKVEMLSPTVDKYKQENKNMAYQGMNECVYHNLWGLLLTV